MLTLPLLLLFVVVVVVAAVAVVVHGLESRVRFFAIKSWLMGNNAFWI